MKQEAIKETEGKLSYVDLPYKAIQSMAKVFGDSKKSGKYPRDNHFKPIKNTDLLDSIQRHLIAYINGEDIDSSGNSHFSHIMSNAAMLEEGRINGTLIEDRIVRENPKSIMTLVSELKIPKFANPTENMKFYKEEPDIYTTQGGEND